MAKKFLVICVVVELLAGARSASAEISPALLASLLEEIQALLKKVQGLQAEANRLQPKQNAELEASPLSRGARGEAVRELQMRLARDPSLYPEGTISGYFGALTERAVEKFQAKYALPVTGVADARTREALLQPVPAASQAPTLMYGTNQAPVTAPTSQNKISSDPFAAIEKELLGVQKGAYLSPNHADRIYKDLANLEAKGYSKEKIGSLRAMALGLSPHLQDKEKKETASAPAKRVCPDAPPILTADITDISKVRKITAPGSPTNDRDKYKGHSFIWTDGALVSVYSPVDAVLTSGSFYDEFGRGNYILNFEFQENCAYAFRFDHLHTVTDAVKNALGTGAPLVIPAGEKVGETTGNAASGNWDFGMYNAEKDGPLAPLGAFGLGAKAICWVDYFSPEKQGTYRRLFEGNTLVCSF